MNTKHSKSPSLHKYGVTRGRLPQRAGLPGLNGGGAAAAVPPNTYCLTLISSKTEIYNKHIYSCDHNTSMLQMIKLSIAILHSV